LIRIVRTSPNWWKDTFLSIRIFANGAEVGKIGRNSVLDFRVPKGSIAITARHMGVVTSPPLIVEATPDHRIDFELLINFPTPLRFTMRLRQRY
jgi:hypothetical protein